MLTSIKSCLYLPDLSTHPGGTDITDGSVCLSNNSLASFVLFLLPFSLVKGQVFGPNLICLSDRESFFLFGLEHPFDISLFPRLRESTAVMALVDSLGYEVLGTDKTSFYMKQGFIVVK